jgi:hypothetical protein
MYKDARNMACARIKTPSANMTVLKISLNFNSNLESMAPILIKIDAKRNLKSNRIGVNA